MQFIVQAKRYGAENKAGTSRAYRLSSGLFDGEVLTERRNCKRRPGFSKAKPPQYVDRSSRRIILIKASELARAKDRLYEVGVRCASIDFRVEVVGRKIISKMLTPTLREPRPGAVGRRRRKGFSITGTRATHARPSQRRAGVEAEKPIGDGDGQIEENSTLPIMGQGAATRAASPRPRPHVARRRFP